MYSLPLYEAKYSDKEEWQEIRGSRRRGVEGRSHQLRPRRQHAQDQQSHGDEQLPGVDEVTRLQ